MSGNLVHEPTHSRTHTPESVCCMVDSIFTGLIGIWRLCVVVRETFNASAMTSVKHS